MHDSGGVKGEHVRDRDQDARQIPKDGQQVTRGHNIVADGWAGAVNPHPHPMPHPTPFPTQTHTRKASKTLVFPLFDSWSRTDGPTDRRTDGRTDGQSLS